MDFGGNKTPFEIIRESAFAGTYFKNIYSSVNEKWYSHGRNVISSKILIRHFIVQIVMMSVSINMALNAGYR